MADLPRDPRLISGATVTTPEGRPVWYPSESILTVEDVAALLGVSPDTANRYPIRWSYLTRQTKVCLYRDLLAYIEAKAA